MTSLARTVNEYLDGLPADRREAISAVRDVIRRNLDKGFEEGIQYGMIGYYVPHSVYPAGYHCDPKQPLPFAGLASQKNHMSLHLMGVYSEPQHEAWLRAEWARTGKKLDMGKCCIRFRKLDDLALDVIGEAVARVPLKDYIAHYESVRPAPRTAGPNAPVRSRAAPAKGRAAPAKGRAATAKGRAATAKGRAITKGKPSRTR